MNTGLSASQHWSYLATAAVVTSFSAEDLRPLGGGKSDLAKVGAMLKEYGEPIKSGPVRGRWRLREAARRATLVELARRKQFAEALGTHPRLPDDPTQRALEEIVGCDDPISLSGRTFEELLGLERVVGWLGTVVEGRINLPQIRARIENLRLLDPMSRLLANGFKGRERELQALRAYVDELPSVGVKEWLSRGVQNILDIFRDRPLLMIYGPGGVGKSTLVAKFILDHAGPDQLRPIPFVYLDFDRAFLDPSQPDTIMGEAFRQIGIQFPEFAKKASELEAATMLRLSIEEKVETAKSEHFARAARIFEEFVALLDRLAKSRDSNIMFAIDTFEIVQRRGTTAVYNVLELCARLLEHVPRLRIVIVGRAKLSDAEFASFSDGARLWKPLPLEGFDASAGRAYLRTQFKNMGFSDVPGKVLDRIVRLAQGNPLSLRLAAQVFARMGLPAVEDAVSQAHFNIELNQEWVQSMLHARIVANLPEKLQRIADPGLVVRRITADVIAKVLAEPCGLTIATVEEAEQLFGQLQSEVALVEPFGEGMLRHRPDVRLLMLPLLRQKIGAKAGKIDEAAVAFWEGRTGPTARAEELYHRLWLGQEGAQLDLRWDPKAKPLLEDALDELEALAKVIPIEPAVRIWLSDKLGREYSSALQEKADQAAWERDTEQRARSLLSSGAAKEALRVLRHRKQRSSASSLWLIELDALRLLGRDDEALKLVERALKASNNVQAPSHVHALLLQQAALLERAERFEDALSSVEQAIQIAKALPDETLVFAAGVTRLRLLRKLNRDDQIRTSRERLIDRLKQEDIQSALKERPALLREAAAELGRYQPGLILQAANYLALDSVDTSLQESARSLLQLGVLALKLGESGAAQNWFERAIDISEKLVDHDAVRSILDGLSSVLGIPGGISEVKNWVAQARDIYSKLVSNAQISDNLAQETNDLTTKYRATVDRQLKQTLKGTGVRGLK
jgi:tetratricopeptide (TPR) repeat protein